MGRKNKNSGWHWKGAEERRAARPPQIDANQLYSIQEAAAARDMSPTQFLREVAAGNVRTCRDGSRVKVIGAEIIRTNNELAARQ